MASEVRQFTLTVPPGTLPAAPVTQSCAFPPRNVDALTVVVPPGSSGLLGWRVLVGGVPVIPYLSDQWVITAGETITWPLQGYPDSGAWSVQGYNTGTVAHSAYFRFLLSYVGLGDKPQPVFIADELLSFAPEG